MKAARAMGPAGPADRISMYWAIMAAAVALAFAFVTNQVWEDYYITYRTSRNLVEGHGLVYQVGERVHSFTSPLGVLLPATGLALTGSDTGALWFFRAISIIAFAAAALFAVRHARAAGLGGLALGVALVFGLFDPKTVAFTINGQETGLLLLFAIVAWHELLDLASSRRALLVISLAGLMWTRPDACVLILAMIAGAWCFGVRGSPRELRIRWWRRLLTGSLIAGALYCPWFFWAWSYYGSPVPHTIVAKAATIPGGLSLWGITVAPLRNLVEGGSLDGLFAPIYANLFRGAHDWPDDIIIAWHLLARLAAFAWLLPAVPRPARAASFTVCLGGVYLSQIMPFPWYYAPWTLLASLALGGVVQATYTQLTAFRPLVRIVSAVLMIGVLASLGATMQTTRAQQHWVEDTGRKAIGRWLFENAERHDTVFLEPLGYIGYYSQLKMLDYPGLCAPEVSTLVRAGTRRYAPLIKKLRPTWLVMRPSELVYQQLFEDNSLNDYVFVRKWDVLPQLEATTILPSRRWLEFDAVFLVFKRKPSSSDTLLKQ